MYAGHHMIMNPTYYEKVFDNKVNYNAKIINLSDRSASSVNKISKELNSQDAAQTFNLIKLKQQLTPAQTTSS